MRVKILKDLSSICLESSVLVCNRILSNDLLLIRAANSRPESQDSSKVWDQLLTAGSSIVAVPSMHSQFCNRITPVLVGLTCSLRIWHPRLLLTPSYLSRYDLL